MDLLNSKEIRIAAWIVFCFYLAFLIKVIVFKFPIDLVLTAMKSGEISPLNRRIAFSNFIPMKTIFNYLFFSPSLKVSMRNLLGNVIAFGPLGFLLPIVIKRFNKYGLVLITAFSLSTFFEVFQLLTAMGVFDVDDILLNVTGSICGYFIYRLTSGVFLRSDQSIVIRSGTK